MISLKQLIRKHQNSALVIDTNLLLLLFVGRTNPKRIETFKRTHGRYTRDDYELLETVVRAFRETITTPHILTELSNLAALKGTELDRIRLLIKAEVGTMSEKHAVSRTIVAHDGFLRFGLTDAAIAMLCPKALVLTDDLQLAVFLEQQKIDVINFNHLRTEWWQASSR